MLRLFLSQRFYRFALWGTIACASVAGRLHAAGDADLGPVVELPKFEVTDTRILPPPEKWLYAQVPGFELLSSVSARETKRFVRDFLLLQEVIGVIMPGLTRIDSPVPTTLILSGRGKGFDEFLPADRANDVLTTNSLFFKNSERAAIVVDFAMGELELDADTKEESDPYRAFYREYFRFLIRRQLARPPPEWFEEGLVQIFAATEFSRKTIYFAQIGDGFGGPKTGDFNRLLQRQGLIPMKEFLQPGPPERRDGYWEAQCYAFVHYCLYGNGRRLQQPFLKFIQRLSHEELSETMFKECFGKTFKEMGTELRGHIEFTASTMIQFRAKKGQELPEPPAVELTAAPDAVVGRLKGETLRLAGHDGAARNALIAPYVRGERDPQLLAALGLDELEADHLDRARKFLEAAAAAKATRARAYLELAKLRLADIRDQVPPDKNFDAKQTAAVLEPLLIARSQPPRMVDVYSLYVETLLRAEAPPTREQYEVVVEGANAFPGNLPLIYMAAQLGAERGFPIPARQLAEHGMKYAGTDAARAQFAQLAAKLPPLPQRTATPSPPAKSK